jgi:hypothetical protein
MKDVPSPELIALARRLAEAGKLPRMQRLSDDRRYSDEELARILEDATHSEVHGEGRVEDSGGYSLSEIREIAREAGIDPEQVDRAAARLVASPEVGVEHRPARSSSFSRVIHEERVIGRALNDGEMRALAKQVEMVLNEPGHSNVWGDWAEWRDLRNRLYVGIVRGGNRTRIRVIADQWPELRQGLAAIVLAIVIVASFLMSTLEPVAAVPIIAIAIAAALKFWGRQSAKSRSYLNELLDMLEDSVRTR